MRTEALDWLKNPILRRAIKEARLGASEQLRAEALFFLWSFVPTIAQRAGLPAPQSARRDTIRVEIVHGTH